MKECERKKCKELRVNVIESMNIARLQQQMHDEHSNTNATNFNFQLKFYSIFSCCSFTLFIFLLHCLCQSFSLISWLSRSFALQINKNNNNNNNTINKFTFKYGCWCEYQMRVHLLSVSFVAFENLMARFEWNTCAWVCVCVCLKL